MVQSRDRRVHGISQDGYEVVRYERAGKWFLEDGPDKRIRALRIADAAALAAEGRAHLDKPGGQAFDKRVRDLREPKPAVCVCGHRLAIHEYPMACKGGVSFPDETVACDCRRDIPYEGIDADRKLLADEVKRA